MAHKLVVVVLFLYGTCSVKPVYYTEEKKVAADATTNFHQKLNDQHYEELWAMTDERARAIKSKQDFMLLVQMIRSQLGTVQHTEFVSADATPGQGYIRVRAEYITRFENASRREGFEWYVQDGQARLFSYSQGDP